MTPRFSSMNIQSNIIIFFVAFLFGGAAAFLGTGIFLKPDIQHVIEYVSSETGVKVIREKDVPLPPALLLNPLIYEWTARIDGTIVEKSKDTFVLERDGMRALITKTGLTGFIEPGSLIPVYVQYEDLSIGDRLKGGVYIFGKKTGAGKNIVGGVFIVESKSI